MLKKELLDGLTDALKKVVAYQGKALSRRNDWGAINFEEANEDVQTVLSLSSTLCEMPLRFLPNQAANEILQVVKEILPKLESVDQFSLTQGDPNHRRSEIVAGLHQSCDRFYQDVGKWLPFLAYQQGDVAKNIKQLRSTISEVEQKANVALLNIEQKGKEVDKIVMRTREASADAGVAVFTEDFQHEAESTRRTAMKWLWVTACLAALTLTVPVLAYLFEDCLIVDKSSILLKLASKVVVISVLFTATLWCGRLYKSLRHLSIVNRHRAIGLKTFRAFSAAASDAATKNAVLMETTRSIFANGNTGLIHEPAADSDSNIIQIAGKMMETASTK